MSSDNAVTGARSLMRIRHAGVRRPLRILSRIISRQIGRFGLFFLRRNRPVAAASWMQQLHMHAVVNVRFSRKVTGSEWSRGTDTAKKGLVPRPEIRQRLASIFRTPAVPIHTRREFPLAMADDRARAWRKSAPVSATRLTKVANVGFQTGVATAEAAPRQLSVDHLVQRCMQTVEQRQRMLRRRSQTFLHSPIASVVKRAGIASGSPQRRQVLSEALLHRWVRHHSGNRMPDNWRRAALVYVSPPHAASTNSPPAAQAVESKVLQAGQVTPLFAVETKTPEVDVDALTRQVVDAIDRKMRVERERRGL